MDAGYSPHTVPEMTDDTFKNFMASFATGVAIVTARDEGKSVGATVSSLASVCLRPALLLVCLSRYIYTLRVAEKKKTFGVNILGRHQHALALHFASAQDWKFIDVPHRHSQRGTPIILDSLAFAECSVYDVHQYGDHTVVIGQLLAGSAMPSPDAEPLTYFRRAFSSVHPITL